MDSRFNDPTQPGWADGPGPTPECARVAPLLEALHDGALDERQAHAVAGHVATCAYCAARLRSYAELDQLIRAAPAPVAGPALRAGVYHAIAVASNGRAPRTDTASATRPSIRQAQRPQPGRSLPGDWRPNLPPQTPRAVWAGGVAALCLILAFAVIFVTLQRRGGTVTPVATASVTVQHQGSILPAFHDWRAAYLDRFDAMHVVSLDGKSDTLVTILNGLTVFNSQGNRAAISPDGRYLAYVDSPKYGRIHLVDLAATTPAAQAERVIQGEISDVFWSPNGRWLLAVGTIGKSSSLFRVDPLTATVTPFDGYSISAAVVGWLDPARLLVLMYLPISDVSAPIVRVGGSANPSRNTSRELAQSLSSGQPSYYIVDVAAGTIQAANGVTVPTGWSIVALLPGTPTALITPSSCGAGCPVPPTSYELLDYTTGQITQTPKINSVAVDDIGPLSVDPVGGSGLFAATPFTPQGAGSQLFLCDPVHDGARPLAAGVFAVDWTPDGQTLLLADVASLYNDTGEGALSTLDIEQSQVQPVPIAQNMVRYLGLVRTA